MSFHVGMYILTFVFGVVWGGHGLTIFIRHYISNIDDYNYEDLNKIAWFAIVSAFCGPFSKLYFKG